MTAAVIKGPGDIQDGISIKTNNTIQDFDSEDTQLLIEIRHKFMTILRQVYDHALEEGMVHPDSFVWLLDQNSATTNDETQPL